MKLLSLIFIVAMSLVHADELSDAYQKEYTFLKAQKSELQKRLKQEKLFQNREIKKAQATVQKLQKELVSLSQDNSTLFLNP